MSDIEKLKKCFKTFRKLEMKIWYDGDCVKMQIPCRVDAGFMLVIRARYVYKNGKQMICMSDDGCIVKNNRISFADIRTLCERYHLEYSIIGDKKAIPLDCEIYKVVDEEDFCDVIWHIMELDSDANSLEHKRNIETTNMMNKIREELGLRIGAHFKINDIDCWFDGKGFCANTNHEKQALLFYHWLSGEAHICRQDKVLEKREQKNKQSKTIHDLTITVDKEILKD